MAKHLTKQTKMNDKYVGVFPFKFKDAKSDAVEIPDTIQLVPIGQWEHDMYGSILITKNDIKEFIQNFNSEVRKGVYITAGHEGYAELPAQGWISKLEARDTGLWGKVEWNELGVKTLSDKQFKFISPEFYRDYEDPQTHQIYRNVLIGAALTKSPYFKELEAVVFSDKNINIKFNDNNTMDLKTLLAKKIEELTDAEKAFIVEHKAELTEEEKTAVTSIIDVVPAEDPKPVEAPVEAPKPVEAPVEAPVEDPKPVEAPVTASDKGAMKQISMSEYNLLKEKADAGAQAFKELNEQKLTLAVDALVFSSTNTAGRFLPKSKDNLRAFMEKLDASQRVSFSAILSEVVSSKELFSENGSDEGKPGDARTEVDTKVEAKMKANGKLKYSDALKQVFSENEGLEARYSKELPSVKRIQG